MHRRKLRTLDLFSGIGGFSLALKDVAKTVAYCDSDPAARRVLAARIADGGLERAPIFNDVTTLSGKDVRALRPDMVTAGFPCQDITPINRFAEGLLGERSKLVFEVFRMMRAAPSIKYVLLENSSHIVNMGLEKLLKEFSTLDWSVAWGLFSSLEVGCHHDRKRWVCLACAPGASAPSGVPGFRRVSVSRAPARLIQPSVANTRSSMFLGNAVVPAMIARAYIWLCDALNGKAHDARVGPAYGIMAKSKHVVRHRQADTKTPPMDLQFLINGIVYKKQYWATPTRRKPYNCQRNTSNLRHLSCQVILERKAAGEGVLNARFVEWLMGFPPKWSSE